MPKDAKASRVVANPPANSIAGISDSPLWIMFRVSPTRTCSCDPSAKVDSLGASSSTKMSPCLVAAYLRISAGAACPAIVSTMPPLTYIIPASTEALWAKAHARPSACAIATGSCRAVNEMRACFHCFATLHSSARRAVFPTLGAHELGMWYPSLMTYLHGVRI